MSPRRESASTVSEPGTHATPTCTTHTHAPDSVPSFHPGRRVRALFCAPRARARPGWRRAARSAPPAPRVCSHMDTPRGAGVSALRGAYRPCRIGRAAEDAPRGRASAARGRQRMHRSRRGRQRSRGCTARMLCSHGCTARPLRRAAPRHGAAHEVPQGGGCRQQYPVCTGSLRPVSRRSTQAADCSRLQPCSRSRLRQGADCTPPSLGSRLHAAKPRLSLGPHHHSQPAARTKPGSCHARPAAARLSASPMPWAQRAGPHGLQLHGAAAVLGPG